MSSRRRKRRVSSDDNDSDSEDDLEKQRMAKRQRQREQRQKQRRKEKEQQPKQQSSSLASSQSQSQIEKDTETVDHDNADEIRKLEVEFVRILLFNAAAGKPTKRAELSKLLSAAKATGKKGLNFATVMDDAKATLFDVFGYDVRETPRLDRKGKVVKVKKSVGNRKVTALASSGVFVLKNKLSSQKIAGISESRGTLDHASLGLLLAVVGAIQLNGGSISCELLYGHLWALGFRSGTQHAIFGNWEQHISRTLVSAGYLQRRKVGDHYELSLGARTLTYVSPLDIFQYVASCFGHELDPLTIKELGLADDIRCDDDNDQQSGASSSDDDDDDDDSSSSSSSDESSDSD